MHTEQPIRTYSKDQELVASRREHIAQCAAHLLVKKGYDRTSVREIADACGMGMGNLYHYIGSKEDILYLVIDHGLSRYVEFCEKAFAKLDIISPPEALRKAIGEYYRTVDDSQDLMLFAYQETKNLRLDAREAILDLDRRIVAAFERLLARGCTTGDFSIDNLTLVAHDIVTRGQLWAVRRWFLRKYGSLEQYIKDETELILRAILPPKVMASKG